MTNETYWNTTDSSVVIDGDGHAIDGGARIVVDPTGDITPEITQAIKNGTLRLVETTEQEESDPPMTVEVGTEGNDPEDPEEDPQDDPQTDTNEPSVVNEPEDATLSPKQTAHKKRGPKSQQNEEK